MKKDGKIAKFYKYSNGSNELPNNLCNYFWALVFMIVSLPLTFWTYIPRINSGYNDDYKFRTGFSIITLIIVSLLLFAFAFTGTLIYRYPQVMILVLGIPSILGIFYWLAVRNHPGNPVKELVSDTSTILVNKVKSVKEGYCPKIEWED